MCTNIELRNYPSKQSLYDWSAVKESSWWWYDDSPFKGSTKSGEKPKLIFTRDDSRRGVEVQKFYKCYSSENWRSSELRRSSVMIQALTKTRTTENVEQIFFESNGSVFDLRRKQAYFLHWYLARFKIRSPFRTLKWRPFLHQSFRNLKWKLRSIVVVVVLNEMRETPYLEVALVSTSALTTT